VTGGFAEIVSFVGELAGEVVGVMALGLVGVDHGDGTIHCIVGLMGDAAKRVGGFCEVAYEVVFMADGVLLITDGGEADGLGFPFSVSPCLLV
jgi:hypothetical protein